jgi:hypothetical protein
VTSKAKTACDLCGLALVGEPVPLAIHVEAEDGEGFTGETIDGRAHAECHRFWYDLMHDFNEGYISGDPVEWADDLSAVAGEFNRMHEGDRAEILAYLRWYRALPDALPIA